jgi:hypothetical protein
MNRLTRWLCAGLPLVLAHAGWTAEGLRLFPMTINEADTANARWLRKPVLASRLLDDMEQTNHWSHLGRGQMSLTSERARDGRRSLRLVCPTKGDATSRSGRPWGECVARRDFEGEDWTGVNRLSFWVHPHLPGFKVISMLVKLRNEGAVKVPDGYNREGLNYFLLKPDQWNQVVWEIPHLARDRVTAVEFIYRQQGNEPSATNVVCYDLDRLELQRVAPDPFEGWSLDPGRVAYSHSGYSLHQTKTAVASGLAATEFKLVDTQTGQPVLTKPLQIRQTPVGQFQVLDFSEFNAPGLYRLDAGGVRTRAFTISGNVWEESAWKTLNFFHCERCGTAIPGIHDVCHQDWRASDRGTQVVINGGWHDAGDLSQGLINTAESCYAMFALAEQLRRQDAALARALMQEARWGLDWMQKTRFGDGNRVTWATMDFWTDGVVGNADDMSVQPNNSPYENFTGAATEALAGRLLQTEDAALAAKSQRAAEEDWQFAVDKLKNPSLELASAGALASLELHRLTGGRQYAEKAIELGGVIVESQQREWMPWTMPLAGFFYTSPRHDRILHYFHRGHEQAPVVALAGLCRAFPQHADWMKWYSAVVLHSEYLKRLAEPTEPYGMLCASVYSLDESNDPRFREQVRQGLPLSEKHYLRRFPVWFDFRGNSGTMLSQAKALSAAAALRRNEALFGLVERQLQWHVGRNPFCQSLLYGEGHDYAPQYTALSGDMVGSFPVGIQTRANEDTPYWPTANCYNYKEVWVHPAGRWLWILSDVMARPAPPKEAPFTLAGSQSQGKVRLQLSAVNLSAHQFAIRGSNLKFASDLPASEATERGRTLVWTAEVVSPQEPWVAVVVPDNDVPQALEASAAWPGAKQ